MIHASGSLQAVLIALALAVAILSLTLDVIFRLRESAGEGGIHG